MTPPPIDLLAPALPPRGSEERRRTVRHPGNHRYLFGLTKGVKRRLPASLPYPKFSRTLEAA